MPSKYLIYALVDPRTKQWRYIGKSSTGMRRPWEHAQGWNLRKSDRTHKANWIRKLHSLGLKYEVEILEELPTPENLYTAEHEWIETAKSCGVDLTNGTDGGAGPTGFRHSEETRAILRSKALQQFANPEGRKKASQGNYRRFSKPEERVKRSESAVRAMGNLANRINISRTLGGTSVMDDLGTVFPTINAAARSHGTYPSAVRKVLKGELHTTAGRTFVRCKEVGV